MAEGIGGSRARYLFSLPGDLPCGAVERTQDGTPAPDPEGPPKAPPAAPPEAEARGGRGLALLPDGEGQVGDEGAAGRPQSLPHGHDRRECDLHPGQNEAVGGHHADKRRLVALTLLPYRLNLYPPFGYNLAVGCESLLAGGGAPGDF